MKAWLKEKKGMEGVMNAKPFEFINCFGLPGYKATAIMKEVNFLTNSTIAEK